VRELDDHLGVVEERDRLAVAKGPTLGAAAARAAAQAGFAHADDPAEDDQGEGREYGQV
jgi:hypothetical protein